MLNKRATYAALLWLLTMAFAMRVLGQALQRWAPQPFLPPFDGFQGSNLPYGLLLSVQLVILVVMMIVSRRVRREESGDDADRLQPRKDREIDRPREPIGEEESVRGRHQHRDAIGTDEVRGRAHPLRCR